MNADNQSTATHSSLPAGANDNMLWHIAKRRVAFKITLRVYVVVNLLLIIVWYFTSSNHGYFWPMWPILGWGLGLAFQYAGAYHSTDLFSVEKEYQKLKSDSKHESNN